MKRFTDTNKWDDPWFRALPGVHKLVFLYIIDRCNNAGFWEIDMDSMAFHTKLKPEHLEGALKGLERGIKGASGWAWVRRFLRHQKNEPLNPDNPAHRQIIALISEQLERFQHVPEFKEFEGALKGLKSPIGTGKGIGKGKGSKGESAERGRKSTTTPEEATEYCVSIGLPKSDGEWFVDKCIGNGWTNGGEPIKDWKATIRAWKTAGYMASQKGGNGTGDHVVRVPAAFRVPMSAPPTRPT